MIASKPRKTRASLCGVTASVTLLIFSSQSALAQVTQKGPNLIGGISRPGWGPPPLPAPVNPSPSAGVAYKRNEYGGYTKVEIAPGSSASSQLPNGWFPPTDPGVQKWLASRPTYAPTIPPQYAPPEFKPPGQAPAYVYHPHSTGGSNPQPIFDPASPDYSFFQTKVVPGEFGRVRTNETPHVDFGSRFTNEQSHNSFGFAGHASPAFNEKLYKDYMSADPVLREPFNQVFTWATSQQFMSASGQSDPLHLVSGITYSRGGEQPRDHGFIEETMSQHGDAYQKVIVYHELMHGLDSRLQTWPRQPITGTGHLSAYYSSLDEKFIEAFSKDVNRQTMAAIEQAGLGHLTTPAEAYARAGASVQIPQTDDPDDIAFRKLFPNTMTIMAKKLQEFNLPTPGWPPGAAAAPSGFTAIPGSGGWTLGPGGTHTP